MKFAFSTLGCPDWPIERIVETAVELKYDGVEIRGIKRIFDLSKAGEFSDEKIDATRQLFEGAGMPVCSVDASASFCWDELAKQERAYEEATAHVEIARKLGAPQVRVFGGNMPEGAVREKYARQLADWLKKLGDAAAEKGVLVAIETHDSWCRADELMPVIEMAGCDNVKVLWDLMHPYLHGESMREAADRFGERVCHAHIKDYRGDGELTLLGEGDLPLDEAFKELKRMNFDGYVSLEWEKAWHDELADPEEAFPQAIAFMRKLDSRTG